MPKLSVAIATDMARTLLADAGMSATQAAALTGPSGLWGAMSM